ncbi:hypothetical protein GCM10010240_62160 [Streptomyces griseoviridis]|nr:hypothetical protein GCM10010240_62160 [Streptomyces griseoviridis]
MGCRTGRGWLAANCGSPAAATEAGRTPARESLDAGPVLPVLDGFDELPPAARPAALHALTRELDSGLLTCRTAAWADAVRRGGVLPGARAVRLRSLDLAAVRAYLTRATGRGGAWARVPEAPPARPARALRSPPAVTLARTVYEDPARDPAELADPAASARRSGSRNTCWTPAYRRRSRTDGVRVPAVGAAAVGAGPGARGRRRPPAGGEGRRSRVSGTGERDGHCRASGTGSPVYGRGRPCRPPRRTPPAVRLRRPR